MWPAHCIQCLLFAVHEGRIPDSRKSYVPLNRSKIKGYALLPGSQSNSDLHTILRKTGIQLLRSKEDCPAELIKAVRSDRVEMVEILIDESAVDARHNSLRVFVEPFNLLMLLPLFTGLVHAESKYNLSSLDACSALGEANLEILEHLLTHRVDIRYRHVNGGTVLHFAAARGHEPFVELLLKKGARVDTPMLNGATPLHEAITCYNVSILNRLLERGANVNAAMTGPKFEGATPLHLALYRGRSNMVKPLLDRGANIEAESCLGNILCLAVGNILSLAVGRETESLAQVLSCRPDLNSPRNQAAFRSALEDVCGKKKNVDLLLSYGFELVPDDAKNTKIFFGAIEMNHVEIVRKLLKWGASVHQRFSWKNDCNGDGCKKDLTPLHAAASSCDEEMMQLLLDHGANVSAKNDRGETPLRRAVEYDNIQTVKFLLANGARVQDEPHLLHIAAEEADESTEVVEILLQNGTDINALNDEGLSPVMVASSRGQAEVMQLLCRHGALIDMDDDATLNEFLKHIAVGNSSDVKVFIQNGFDVESEMADFLISAIKSESSGLVEFFLELEDGPGISTFINVNILREAAELERLEVGEAVLEYAYLNRNLLAISSIFDEFGKYGRLDEYPGSDSSDDLNFTNSASYTKFQKFAKNHVIKIQAADLRENKEERIFCLPPWRRISSYRKDCEAEVAALKSEKIGDSDITFYEILDATVPEIVSYTRKESIVEVLKAYGGYRDRFPIYGSIIFRRFHKGYYRRTLLDQGIRMFDFLFQGSGLPRELKERIVGLLRNQNLLVLNNVCRLPDKKSSTASTV